MSNSDLIFMKYFVSSVKINMLTAEWRSLIYTRKSKGPSMLLCGTPVGRYLDRQLLIEAHWALLYIYDLNHLQIVPCCRVLLTVHCNEQLFYFLKTQNLLNYIFPIMNYKSKKLECHLINSQMHVISLKNYIIRCLNSCFVFLCNVYYPIL